MKDRLAILGGTPLGGPKMPRHPVFTRSAIKRVVCLLERGETVGLGRINPVVAEAERAVSDYHDGRHALVLNSGHAALMAALMGLEIGPGDEVITTPYTWGASVSCILHVGAIPVFVDVDRLTGLLNPAKIEPAITPRTKAILAVHLYGQPCDMAAINRIARKHGLLVIEDGSQSHGATVGGAVVGNHSDAAGFSCMGGKLLATAEAGYLVTPHEDVFWKAAMMCQHYGRSGEAGFPSKLKPYADSLVFTFRVSPIVAALFPSQIRRLPGQIEGRRRNVDLLRRAMAKCRFVEFPDYADDVRPSYHMVTMNYRPEVAGVERQTMLRALQAEGVGVFTYVPSPIHTWSRLQWKEYAGPVPFWLEQLRRAGTDYRAVALPDCEYKVSRAMEMGWNFYRPAAAGMRRLAAAFLKVQDHLADLAAWERAQGTAGEPEESAIVQAARRAAISYRRT